MSILQRPRPQKPKRSKFKIGCIAFLAIFALGLLAIQELTMTDAEKAVYNEQSRQRSEKDKAKELERRTTRETLVMAPGDMVSYEVVSFMGGKYDVAIDAGGEPFSFVILESKHADAYSKLPYGDTIPASMGHTHQMTDVQKVSLGNVSTGPGAWQFVIVAPPDRKSSLSVNVVIVPK